MKTLKDTCIRCGVPIEFEMVDGEGRVECVNGHVNRAAQVIKGRPVCIPIGRML
jgi:hypothetical protein